MLCCTCCQQHHHTHPSGQDMNINTNLPGQLGGKQQVCIHSHLPGQGGGGPVSISTAIKQVQQVFSEDGGDSLRSSYSRPGGSKTPTRNKHGGSVDIGNPSHRGPMKRPQGGLRGSFDSIGSRMGSFAMNEYSTSNNFDASFLINDIATLRSELMATKRKLDLLDEEKVTRQLVEKLCGEALAEQRRRDNRTDYRSMIEDADKSIRELVHEMILLKRTQEQGVESMRDELHKAMDHTVKGAIDSITDNLRDTVVSTKALCLGCGRTSVVKTEATAPSSPQPFFPHLSASSLPGPDVLRAGFKMPVRSGSPPPDIPLLMKGKVAYDTKSSRATTSPSEDLTPLVSPMAGGGTGSFTDTDFDHDEHPHPKGFSRDGKQLITFCCICLFLLYLI
ncbi:hypothetical protein EON65_11765 [archaeon]|nr:MAG: hypothetical protein EON65_11765 [archaeon]